MQRITEWMQGRPSVVIGAALAVTALLAIPFLTMAPTVSASTEPDGPVFDARDLVEERFASSVYQMFFIFEADDADLVSKQGLTALLAAEDSLRSDPDLGPTLITAFDADSATPIDGIITIADVVDGAIPGGIVSVDDTTVRQVASTVIDRLGPDSPALNLSARSERQSDGTWLVPAISAPVLADNDVLGFGSNSITLGGDTAPEEYARDVQDVLRSVDGITVSGIALDVNLTSQEQGQLAGPFIGFTILAVLLLVGLMFRSYWVLAIVGVALGALMIWLKGISNLIGLKDDLVLSLIVPIAMVSFGVDFAFHAVGRYREERRDGLMPGRAFVVGLAAVSGALILALASDTAAFLANISSGIESIVQFGIGAAIALVSAFLLLGVVAPLAVSVVEDRVAPPEPGRRATIGRVTGSALAGTLVMASVLLMVFVLPWAGVVAYAATLIITLVIPYLRRRDPEASAAAVTDDVDRLARPIGSLVTALTRRRWIVLPVALGLSAVAAFYAVQVPAEFDVEDFFSSDSEFVVALDKLDVHVGDQGGEPAQLYVEGPLDDPAALGQLDSRLDEIRRLGTDRLARNGDGVRIERGVFSVFEAVYSSQAAVGLIAAESGVEMTDDDGNGIPDTSEQVVAVYTVGRELGVPFDAERLALTPDEVATSIAIDGGDYATVFELGLVDSRAQESVSEAEAVLTPIADRISDDFGGSFVQVTGSPFVREASLEATNRALQVSLPIAVVLCVIVATVFLRSIRFGLVSVVPILMTVSWLYAFMERAGYAINIVTATIAAVSVGIGIDFAIHYIVRFREELDRNPDRISAVRAAAEGTGTALVASAVSSAVGFGILSLAPMPLFAAYGLLTAIMIAMALVATLLVLPSLLYLIAPTPADIDLREPSLDPTRA